MINTIEKKLIVIGAAVAIIVAALTLTLANAHEVDATGSIVVYQPTCGLQPKDGRIIVDFKDATGKYPRLKNPTLQTYSQNVSIPAGKYKMTAVSFDGYSTRATTDASIEDHEQWNLEVWNGGTKIDNFGPTSDIPDGVTKAYSTTTFAANGVTFNQAINKVVLKHAFMNLSPEPHSVVPVCVAFDKITTPPPAPACTLTVSDNSITRGQSTNLRWTSDNATTFSLNQGIGNVALNGNRNVSPQNTITYTGTATNAAGQSATCSKTVTVTPPVTPPCNCNLSANKTTINAGESVTLSWSSENGASATIDNGVGSVALNGTKVVSPTVTTTYKITIRGTDGSTKTCEVTIVVRPRDVTPVCSLQPKDGRIIVDFKRNDGSYAKLLSTNDSVISKDVSIPAGTYKVTTDSYDSYQGRSNTPASEQNHEQWGLEIWNSGSVMEDLGPTTDLQDNVEEARKVDVLSDRATFGSTISKLVAYHAFSNEPVPNSVYPVCVAFDKIQTESYTPQCTLSANKDEVYAGDSVTLNWTSRYATSGTLDPEIGDIDLNGSAEVTVSNDTTYKTTFRDDKGHTVKCEKKITIKDRPVSHEPQCTLTLSTDTYTQGDSDMVRLSWDATNVTGGFIDNGVGNVAPNGHIDFIPNQDTVYTGTFTGTGYYGNATCSARIVVKRPQCTVNCGGGGFEQPRVSITSRSLPNESPLAFVYLSQVPYTGFPATPFETALYWFALIVISGMIAYLIIVKNILWHIAGKIFGMNTAKSEAEALPHIVANREDFIHAHYAKNGDAETTAPQTYRTPVAAPAGFAPANLPGAEVSGNSYFETTPASDAASLRDTLEAKAHQDQILLSPEALDMIIAQSGNREDAALQTLLAVVEKAKMLFPREDGWILLNRERLQTIVGESAPAHPSVPDHMVTPREPMNPHVEAIRARFAEATEAVAEVVSHTLPTMPARQEKNISSSRIAPGSVTVAGFVTAIAEGKEEEAFGMLRALAPSGKAHEFIMQVIAALDDVYKNRIEGGKKVDPKLAEKVGPLSNADIEELLAVFLGGVDYTYSSELTGSKIAVAKAIEFFGKRR